MANYIGNQPSYGEFKRLDSISSSFNGSTTTFNLTYNSVSTPVGDASQLIVSLNGIIQEPLNSYTLGVGGSSIVFSSAPVSGDTCFIMYIGGAGGTVTTISDGSVTASKLDASLKDYYEDEFTANGSTTDFTLSRDSIGVNQLLVTIDGIVQPTSAYTASGTTLTISPALPNGTNIRVVHMGAKAGVFVPQSGSVGLNELDLTAIDARYYQSGDSINVASITSQNITADGIIKSARDNYSKVSLANTGTPYEYQVENNGSNFRITDSTAGQTRLTINTTGNVGIGTSSPAFGLSVEKDNGSGYVGLFRKSVSDPALTIQTTGGVTQLQGLNADLTAVHGIAMQISGGNVGIGTSSPSATLHVAGPVLIQNANAINELSFSGSEYTNIYSGTASGFDIGTTSSGGSSFLRFLTENTERVRIDASGNVGIGGSVDNHGGYGRCLQISGTEAAIELKSGSDYGYLAQNGTNMQFRNVANGNALFYTNNTERMRIDSEGRVTTPYQPTFQARRYTGGGTAIAHLSVITYDEAILNISGSFNSGTGRFTAPIAGTYFFFWSNTGGAAASVHRTYIRKNGNSNWGAGYRFENRAYTNNPYPYNTHQVIVPLALNDYVDIYYECDAGSGSYLYADVTDGPTFGGYLLG